MHRAIGAALASLALGGCVTDRQTDTPRSATEELLISAAADRAAEALGDKVPAGSLLFLDTSNFDATDGKYAVGAIRDALLRHGDRLADKKEQADVVLEVRSGALGTDDHEFLIGMPAISVPVPLAGALSLPKLALYDRTVQKGVAKFAATGIDQKTHELVVSTAPQYGYAHKTSHIVLLVVGWSRNDTIPKPQQDPEDN
jgi:Family of unknown function (DUF6655)